MYRFIASILLAIMLCASATAFAGKPVTLATLEWEPYIGSNLPDQGYVAEVVREALRRGGYDLHLKFMPWARVVKQAEAGKFHGYFPEYYSDEVALKFFFSEPFPGGPLGFFQKKGAGITYKELPDLRPYTIGVVRGYVNTEQFDNAAYLQKDEAPDDLTNIRKVLAGRLDLMVGDKFVGKHIAKTEMPDKADLLEFMEPPLEEKDLFVCFPRTLGESPELQKAFNKALAEMREDGTLQKILEKHGF